MILEENDPMEIGFGNAGERMDATVTVEQVAEHLERRDPFSRREFCEFLGVGESTLSGWLSAGKIPKMAKVAFGLLITLHELKMRVEDQERAVELTPIPVQIGEEWALVKLELQGSGKPGTSSADYLGKVLALGIEDRNTAVALAQGVRAIDVASEATDVYADHIEKTSRDKGKLEYVRDLRDQATTIKEKADDYENWLNEQDRSTKDALN